MQGLRSLLGRLDEALAVSAAQKLGPGAPFPGQRSSVFRQSIAAVDGSAMRRQSAALQPAASRRQSSVAEGAATRRQSSVPVQAIPEDGAADSVASAGSRRTSKVGHKKCYARHMKHVLVHLE